MNQPGLNSIFEGRFRILNQLGAGGMSTVYEVEDVGVRRIVALKLLQTDSLSGEKSRLRFQREAQAAGGLNHPHIARILEFGVASSGEPYLVMECCHGQSLSQVLKTNGAFPEKIAREILKQSMSALAHAHAHRVIHRDLKPGNIMLCDSEDGQVNVKIIDFGIAKFDLADSPELTKTGEIFGSPLYMSPEQIDGEKITDKSDQYSLGCLFYECLTGAPPHVGKTSIETFVKQKTNQVLSLKEASMGGIFSENTQMIVDRLLEKDPAKRFDSMSDALDALTFQVVAPKVVATPSPTERKNQGVNRTVLLVSLLLVAVSVLGVWGIWSLTGHQNAVPQPSTFINLDTVSGPLDDVNTVQTNHQCLVEEANLRQTDFEFADRAITNEALRGFVDHRQGKYLNLTNDVNITDAGMEYIKHIPWERLNLHTTGITDKGLSVLNLKLINILDLERTQVTDAGLKYLSHCLKMTSLSLKHNNVSAAGLAYLVNLPKLDELDLSDTKCGAAELAQVQKMHITRLYLNHNPVRDDGLKMLATTPVRNLSLQQTEISDKGLKYLYSCKQLNHIDLSGCPYVTSGGIAALKKAMPKLDVEAEKGTVPFF